MGCQITCSPFEQTFNGNMGDDEENKVKIDSDIRKSHREEKFPGQLLVEKSFPAA